MKKKILAAATGALILGGGFFGVVKTFGGPAPVTLEIATAKQIVWNKPTTDEQWAEDVKVESLDTRSTAVLTTMIAAHTTKLQKEINTNKKYKECPECIYYEYYQQFSGNGMDDVTAKAEATTAAATAIAEHQWSIEKLQQSIERMNKEVELRAKGFVLIEGAQPAFGSVLPSSRIRHIRD